MGGADGVVDRLAEVGGGLGRRDATAEAELGDVVDDGLDLPVAALAGLNLGEVGLPDAVAAIELLAKDLAADLRQRTLLGAVVDREGELMVAQQPQDGAGRRGVLGLDHRPDLAVPPLRVRARPVQAARGNPLARRTRPAGPLGRAGGRGTPVVVGAPGQADQRAEPRDIQVSAERLQLSETPCRGRRPARWRAA